MTRLLPLLLLLTACSTGNHYERGAYRPVAPNPTFNPAQDAPHRTGQPGHIRPRPIVPLSPHTRVLPQTPETRQHPGLWSGDRPKAVIGDDGTMRPELFGEKMPVGDGSTHELLHAYQCASSITDWLRAKDPVVFSGLLSLRAPLRACVAASAFLRCLEGVGKLKTDNHEYEKALKSVQKAARRQKTEACSRPDIDSGVVEALNMNLGAEIDQMIDDRLNDTMRGP